MSRSDGFKSSRVQRFKGSAFCVPGFSISKFDGKKP